ncbi:MAG: M28 family peptidase, partial [Clostridia bacterium]|nr:M28 family peptidase [Clostridia bacterium]
MTPVSEYVFEKFQVRKSTKQKDGFIDYIKEFAEKEGYSHRVEKGSFGARNIVIGDPATAKAVYTAHYDTCARLPFPNFITPKNFPYYLLYQLLITAALLVILFAAAFGFGFLVGLAATAMQLGEEITDMLLSLVSLAAYFTVFYLLMNGPANKHTANDNTSGVITLIEIMQALPAEKRNEICFVFFDLEEMGLFGSSGFASKHKKVMTDKLLLNFDCVSDGDTILFAVKQKAKKYIPALEKSFVSDDYFKVDIASKGVFYPSDQANFKGGVGVASLKYSKA